MEKITVIYHLAPLQGDLYSPRNDPDPEMIPNPKMRFRPIKQCKHFNSLSS